jgi:hypothetical protein
VSYYLIKLIKLANNNRLVIDIVYFIDDMRYSEFCSDRLGHSIIGLNFKNRIGSADPLIANPNQIAASLPSLLSATAT